MQAKDRGKHSDQNTQFKMWSEQEFKGDPKQRRLHQLSGTEKDWDMDHRGSLGAWAFSWTKLHHDSHHNGSLHQTDSHSEKADKTYQGIKHITCLMFYTFTLGSKGLYCPESWLQIPWSRTTEKRDSGACEKDYSTLQIPQEGRCPCYNCYLFSVLEIFLFVFFLLNDLSP